MAWTNQDLKCSLPCRAASYLLSFGPIPQHVAFIMDGNRRYANQKSLVTTAGHEHGFTKLTEVLGWCRNLTIPEVTVFAFSTDNFKRPREEVEFLMQLAGEKLTELIARKDELKTHNLCVRAVGNLDLLPDRVRQLAIELTLVTRDNNGSTLNICMAYGNRDELVESIKLLRDGVQKKLIKPSDIDPQLINHCLFTRDCRPLDLLVRTSGEVRLSDFLTWQCSSSRAAYSFVDSYWPEWSCWQFLKCIWNYQLTTTWCQWISSPINSDKWLDQDGNEDVNDPEKSRRIARFQRHVRRRYWRSLEYQQREQALPTAPPDSLSQLRRPSGEL